MWRNIIRDQRGSVSAVFIALLIVVVLLTVAFLEREWANYILKMAEQTADFAAEAAARAHVVKDTVTVDRTHWVWVDCPLDINGNPTCLGYWSPVYDQLHFDQMPEEELLGNWSSMTGCGGDPFADGFRCSTLIDERRIEFSGATDAIAEDVWTLNWPQRAHVSAVLNQVEYSGSADGKVSWSRVVYVSVDLDIGSLFGVIPWEHRVPVTGAAAVKMRPLVLPNTILH